MKLYINGKTVDFLQGSISYSGIVEFAGHNLNSQNYIVKFKVLDKEKTIQHGEIKPGENFDMKEWLNEDFIIKIRVRGHATVS